MQTGRASERESPRLYRGARRAVVRKKMGEESYDLEGGGEGEMAFSDKSVRRGFIKKVYGIITVQVLPMRGKAGKLANPILYLLFPSFY